MPAVAGNQDNWTYWRTAATHLQNLYAKLPAMNVVCTMLKLGSAFLHSVCTCMHFVTHQCKFACCTLLLLLQAAYTTPATHLCTLSQSKHKRSCNHHWSVSFPVAACRAKDSSGQLATAWRLVQVQQVYSVTITLPLTLAAANMTAAQAQADQITTASTGLANALGAGLIAGQPSRA